jgi:hypothetical protein
LLFLATSKRPSFTLFWLTWSYIFTVNTQMFAMFWLEIIISKVFRKWHIVVLGYSVDYYCSNFYFPLIQIIIQMTSFKVTRLLIKKFLSIDNKNNYFVSQLLTLRNVLVSLYFDSFLTFSIFWQIFICCWKKCLEKMEEALFCLSSGTFTLNYKVKYVNYLLWENSFFSKCLVGVLVNNKIVHAMI